MRLSLSRGHAIESLEGCKDTRSRDKGMGDRRPPCSLLRTMYLDLYIVEKGGGGGGGGCYVRSPRHVRCIGLRKIFCVCRGVGLGRTARRRALRVTLVLRSYHVDWVCGAFGKVFPLKVGVAGVIDGVCVAQFRVRAGFGLAPDSFTQRGGSTSRGRLGGCCVLYAIDAHRLYRLSPDPYFPCTVPTRPLARQEHVEHALAAPGTRRRRTGGRH
jgi:hypothetical protein